MKNLSRSRCFTFFVILTVTSVTHAFASDVLLQTSDSLRSARDTIESASPVEREGQRVRVIPTQAWVMAASLLFAGVIGTELSTIGAEDRFPDWTKDNGNQAPPLPEWVDLSKMMELRYALVTKIDSALQVAEPTVNLSTLNSQELLNLYSDVLTHADSIGRVAESENVLANEIFLKIMEEKVRGYQRIQTSPAIESKLSKANPALVYHEILTLMTSEVRDGISPSILFAMKALQNPAISVPIKAAAESSAAVPSLFTDEALVRVAELPKIGVRVRSYLEASPEVMAAKMLSLEIAENAVADKATQRAAPEGPRGMADVAVLAGTGAVMLAFLAHDKTWLKEQIILTEVQWSTLVKGLKTLQTELDRAANTILNIEHRIESLPLY